MIGCQVLAPGIGLAVRPSWAHAHAVPHPTPPEATAGGVVRLHMSLGSVKIVQLTEGGKRKKKKK